MQAREIHVENVSLVLKEWARRWKEKEVVMGGSSGGSIGSNDLRSLEERAKQSLKKAADDSSPHVFISFAYEDLDEVNLLRGQAKNEKTDLQFDDFSVKEAFNSANAEYIKRQIREKISRVSVTLVYLSSKSTNSEWVDWEIRETRRQGKEVIGVYKGDAPPSVLPAAFKELKLQCVKWQHEDLKRAIEKASA